MKIIITLAILFSFAFSSVHEFAFAFYDNEHCSVSEYAQELESPSGHDDICDTHFEYHHATMFPQSSTKIQKIYLNNSPSIQKENYFFLTSIDLFRPPRY
jgi:hypothetical protein